MNEALDKKYFVEDLTSGQHLEELFLVVKKTLAETKAGKPYLALTLMDRSGEIEARLWDNALDFDAQAEEGNFILVRGQAKSYRDQVQLTLDSLRRVPETQINLRDFVVTSSRRTEDMILELERYIDEMRDKPLQALLRALFQGETLARFKQAPAAKKMHHAYIGGLLEHTLSVTGMAFRVAEHYPGLDKDMLMAGALLHDLAKIEELDYSNPAIQYTDRGRLIGHIVLGVEMVRQTAETLPERIPQERLDLLVHMILSHHGQLMFGSPVLPMTPEAILLHHLDDMDAKMNHINTLRAKMDSSMWQWTDYQRHLERYLYLRGERSGEPDEGELLDLLKPPGAVKKKNKGKSADESAGKMIAQQQSLF